jgi:hypothetical protein
MSWGTVRTAIAIGLAFAAQVAAADPGVARKLLDDADRALNNQDFRRAAASYEKALAQKGLPRVMLIRAYAGVGTSSALLTRRPRAVWAFKRLLAVGPTWKMPADATSRVRDAFQEALRFWAGKDPPDIALRHAPNAVPGQPYSITARIPSDPLGLVRGFRLNWRVGEASGEVSTRATVEAELKVPGSQMAPPSLDFLVEAIDERGSVVAESELNTVPVGSAVPPPAPPPPPPRVVEAPPDPEEEPPPRVPRREEPEERPTEPAVEERLEEREAGSGSFARLHLSASVFSLLLSRGFGMETALTFSPVDYIDVGAGAVITGHAIGAQGLFTFHGTSGRFRPFVQLRAAYQPFYTDGGPFEFNRPKELYLGVSWVFGAQFGATMELGPGRFSLGAVGEGYILPETVESRPWGALLMAGYELDFLGGNGIGGGGG